VGYEVGVGEGLCECGEREHRDHVLKYVKLEEERRVIWNTWGERGKGGVLMDMKWWLFEKSGVEAVRKFGEEMGWMNLTWGERRKWNSERE